MPIASLLFVMGDELLEIRVSLLQCCSKLQRDHFRENLKQQKMIIDPKIGIFTLFENTVDSRYSGILAANFELNSQFFSGYQKLFY